MTQLTSTFKFLDKASRPKNALIIIYDLEGFSRFFNQPDVQNYVPTFLNHISSAVSTSLFGGDSYWIDTKSRALELRVVHEKFMGDGGLYVLLPPKDASDFDANQLAILCNRLWNVKKKFDKILAKALEKVPVAEVPQKIRFGLSRGTVYELHRQSSTNREYIGFCINLASRLQSYCPDLGFIASARLMLPDAELTKNGYIRVVATKLKGFSSEIVIVDKNEYDKLDAETKADLFKEIKAP